MKPRGVIALGFLLTILLGAVLFALPAADPAGHGLPFGKALFTACSAVCITGLSVIEPGTDLTPFGQGVLVLLVEFGCVGIMTLGTFLLVLIGRRLSLASEFSLVGAYGRRGVTGLRGLVRWIVFSTLVIQALGTVVLWQRFTAGVPPPVAFRDGGAWFRAAFYAVMAFANAGFALEPGSLAIFRSQPVVLVTLTVEVLLGGFGFLVIYNLCSIRFWQRNLITRGRLSLHSRVVLTMSAVLLAFAFLSFLLVEGRHALAGLPWVDRIAVSLFQAVAPRSCGYTVVPVESTYDVTRFISGVLMFIGAAPGGSGGGIKVTTFLVFLLTIAAIYRGRYETVIFRRTVPMDIVRESFVIFFCFTTLIAVAMTALLVSEAADPALTFERLLYETVSAVTTTGLSYGDTTLRLSPVGRGVIMACMFLGRLGAISVVMLVGGRDETPCVIRYPKEELVVG